MLGDLLRPGLNLVICGTAAGTESARRGAYYAGRGNKFWSILNETRLTPRQLAPNEYHLLLDYGIGLTDVVKGQAGNDADIDFDLADPTGLVAKIEQYQPAILAFNGKKAATIFFDTNKVTYGRQSTTIGQTQLFVAPSTSGAANRFWDAGSWNELARRARAAAG